MAKGFVKQGQQDNADVSVQAQYSIVDVDEVPIFARELFVLHGYRDDYTLTQCLSSILLWHNETMNM